MKRAHDCKDVINLIWKFIRLLRSLTILENVPPGLVAVRSLVSDLLV